MPGIRKEIKMKVKSTGNLREKLLMRKCQNTMYHN